MEEIINYLINQLSSTEALLISLLNDNQKIQALKLALGIVNLDTLMKSIPMHSNVSKNATLKSYDYLNDNLEYSYLATRERYFTNESDAEYYSEHHECPKGCDSSWYKDEAKSLIYRGVYYTSSTSSTSLKEWIKNAKVE